MTVQIRPALKTDAESVAVFLNRHMNNKIPVERWRNLFHTPWAMPPDAPDYGRVAIVRGEVVGFAGRVHSERIVDGRRELIGNLNSWYMRKDHRNSSVGLRLHKELLETRGASTLVTFSIAKRTYPIYDRWGFGMLDEHRWLWRGNDAPRGDVEIITERDAVNRIIDAYQQQMLHDHRSVDVRPALIRDDSGDCLAVITSKRKKGDILFLDVLHLSDSAVFEAHAQEIANRLLPEKHSVLAVDSRFLASTPLGAERVPIPVPRRYISDSLAPGNVDMLYSEIVLLNLKLS